MLHKEIVLPYASKLNRINNSLFDILFALVASFIFLGCTNLFGIQGMFILCSMVVAVVYILLKGRIVINLSFILSILFVIFYSVSAFIYSRETLFSVFFCTVNMRQHRSTYFSAVYFFT